MSNIEKIRQEIERLENMDYPCDTSEQATGFYNALDCLSDFIDSLPEEICKDSLQVTETCKENTDSFTCLEEAAARYEQENRQSILSSVDIVDAFIAGAEWQKKQVR